jgi:hypothetical protein
MIGAVLADIGLGDVIWGLVVFFFMVMYLMMLFSVIIDLVRDDTTGGVGKAGWVLFLLVLPLISVIVYLVVRGGGMAARATRRAEQIDNGLQASSPVDQLATAKQLLDAGAIDAAEYAELKQRLLS